MNSDELHDGESQRRALLKSARRRGPAIILAVLGTLGLALPSSSAQTVSEETMRQWGEETLTTIDADFWMPDRGLYAERAASRRGGSRDAAFMWSSGVQLSALAAASRLAPDKYSPRLTDAIKGLNTYWKAKEGVSGYDVQPEPAAPDRYYDDNAWIVLGLVEAYEATHDAALLDRAEATLAFVLSGEDDQLGGGVYWRERRKTSKNTCSNAPAVVAALRLYGARQRPEQLETAKRIDAWTVANLQDSDGLFWDNISLNGRVDRRKYSYNSALMIRANCLFHRITGEPKWLTEAQRMARAAEAEWVAPDTGGIRDSGRFAHMLLEAFLAVHAEDGDPHWLQITQRALTYVHDELREAEGHYPGRWDGRRDRGRGRAAALIDQASAARGFLVAALAMRPAGETGAAAERSEAVTRPAVSLTPETDQPQPPAE